MAVYFATKAYVLHFSEALANELHGIGRHRNLPVPGRDGHGVPQARASHRPAPAEVRFDGCRTVAEDGYRAMMAGKPVVISGFKNWLLAQSVRFSPRRAVTAIARKIQEK